jgi:hypothetical protein
MQPAYGPSPPQALDVQAALDEMEWDATDVSVPLLVPAGREGESRDSARIPTGFDAARHSCRDRSRFRYGSGVVAQCLVLLGSVAQKFWPQMMAT